MQDIATKASYTGAFTSFMTGRIANMFPHINNWADIASIVGIILAIATFIIGWYYKKKTFELKKLELERKANDKKNS